MPQKSTLTITIVLHRDRDKRIRELEDEVRRLTEYINHLKLEARKRIQELQSEINTLTDQLSEKVK